MTITVDNMKMKEDKWKTNPFAKKYKEKLSKGRALEKKKK